MLDILRKILGQRIINYYHLACAVLANILYGFPSRKLHVIGVTGTDGKTTTVNMIASVLRAAGLKTAHLSTINAQIGSKVYDTGLHTTTPSSFSLQKFVSQAVRAGSKYLVLEITSHALDQYRTWGIEFESAVITNVSHEHLDYHKNLESYMAAKARLFRNVEFGIVNRDDQSYEALTLALSRTGRGNLLTYGMDSKAIIWADEIKEELTHTEFTAHVLGETFQVKLNLPGRFNVYNALAAVAVGKVYGLKAEAMAAGLERVINIPGRMEFVTSPRPSPKSERGLEVLVDFAHTPNALEQLLKFSRPRISGRLILVFGSAGERDQTKRPLMGEAADKYADIIILTREDNRSENVEEICKQIAKGIKGKEYLIIPDRREAIRTALRQAQGSDDLVVVTGKGHEQSLNVDGREMPWDDRRVVREELSKLNTDLSPNLSPLPGERSVPPQEMGRD